MKRAVILGIVWTVVVIVGAVILFQHIGTTPEQQVSDEKRLQLLGVSIVMVLAAGYAAIWQVFLRGSRRPPGS